MVDSVRNALNEVIAYDDERPSAPFEHCVVALAAFGLLATALTAPSRGQAVGRAVLAGALLLRSASGQDGLRKWAQAPRPADAAGKLVVAKS